jgi:1-aminocyclopropane-1-carboxylate deaminase/D-cysteine desulfhydrase-like pyridoxal-dependent ACC family enzyme
LTGLATGGNKTRMFEYVLGEAKKRGADTVVGGAAVQSNYCRQLAASCAKLGLDCHLVLRKVRGERDQEIQGGLLLDLLVGARVELIDGVDWVGLGALIRQKAEALEAQGRRVHLARVGDESGLGLDACAYVQAAVELLEQAQELNLDIDEIWLCSSDATQSGLAIALKHLQVPIRLVGVPALPALFAYAETLGLDELLKRG